MASPMVAARTAAPQFDVWTTSPKKAKSPYGIPIIDECTNCSLRTDNFFCGLSEAALKALQKIKHTTTYPTGAIIFMEGQPTRGIYILCQGRVKLQTTNSDGRTLILKIAQPGEGLGLSSTITGKPYETTAEILQPAQLAYISRIDFLRFMAEHSDACLHFVEHLGRDCHAAYELVRSIGLSESVSERLARFLLEWSANGSVSNGLLRVKLALTHQEMAQLIGTSRETVTRTLSEFKKQGIIELNGSTMILRNKATLEELAAA
ncbi:MAG TPA: Crp/Fnr family transcriptional regulator [Methylomirabilota bacterium]|nr:Crp/Fnr family transcriptional regulator [Methylomirabilota bacterium]